MWQEVKFYTCLQKSHFICFRVVDLYSDLALPVGRGWGLVKGWTSIMLPNYILGYIWVGSFVYSFISLLFK